MDYKVVAHRVDAHGSLARAKAAEVVLGTDMAGRQDAFNPVELLLAALAACMIKGVERVTPMLAFQFETVEVRLEATRQDSPPKLVAVANAVHPSTATSNRQRMTLLGPNLSSQEPNGNWVAANPRK